MKVLRVTMPDGSRWDIPVKVIAENRAKSYLDYDDEFKNMEEALKDTSKNGKPTKISISSKIWEDIG